MKPPLSLHLVLIGVLLLACNAAALSATPSSTPTVPASSTTSIPSSVPSALPSPNLAPQPSATAATYLPLITKTAPPGQAPRPLPDTTGGVHIFNDQLDSSMSDAQWQFAATHYDGVQKMTRPDADRLRAINPQMLILHYRLGDALGYRGVQNGCQPTGDWLMIVEGADWVQEWPGDASVQEDWFYHWPENSFTRLLNCDWGWYLAELKDPAWRNYWQGEVLRQVQTNDDDGVFMDSLSVPNFLGGDRYDPNLPALDETFEAAWSRRITDWLNWLQGQPLGNYYLVPNVGMWITTRDATDYSPADGVMVEGFAMYGDGSPLDPGDWALQMNRSLSLIAQGKALIAQPSAISAAQERMFAVGSYLLIKGNRTYLNIEVSLEPEWYPEYDLPIGAPLGSAGNDIANLYDAAHQVYRRNFDNGFVLVNPSTAHTATIELGGTFYLAQASGGGLLPADGVPTGTLTYTAVTRLILPPYSSGVLFNSQP